MLLCRGNYVPPVNGARRGGASSCTRARSTAGGSGGGWWLERGKACLALFIVHIALPAAVSTCVPHQNLTASERRQRRVPSPRSAARADPKPRVGLQSIRQPSGAAAAPMSGECVLQQCAASSSCLLPKPRCMLQPTGITPPMRRRAGSSCGGGGRDRPSGGGGGRAAGGGSGGSRPARQQRSSCSWERGGGR